MIRRLGWTLAALLIASAADAQVTRGVSWTSATAPAGGDSTMPSLSRDGRWATFESAASNLASDDQNGVRDVFLVDRLTTDVRLISRGPGGSVGNAASYAASISGDGRVVAFVSEASNLVAGSTGRAVYLFDRSTSLMSRVPLPAGVRPDTHEVLRRLISLSGDGRFVAFGAYVEPRSAYPFAVLFDRLHGTLTTLGEGLHPRLNAAGSLIAVEAYKAPDTPTTPPVAGLRFIDLATGAVGERLFPTSPGTGGDCRFPSMSDSGRWVAYECRVPDAIPLHARLTRVYLHDRETRSSVEVSAPPPGVARRHSLAPEISADGRFVAFTSFTRLVPAVDGEVGHVFRYDRTTGALDLLSRDSSGTALPFGAYGAAVDASGTLVALSTPQPVNVSDTNGRDDIYLVDPGCSYAVTPTSLVFAPGGGTASVGISTAAGCLWSAGTGVPGFFGTRVPRGGSGSGTQELVASANTSGVVRTGTVSIASRTVTVSQSPAVGPLITAHPSDAAVGVGTSALFRVAATGDPAPTFRWQMSNDGAAWYFMADSAPYSGTTSAELIVANVPAVPFWNRFRAVVSNVAGTATSGAARLTVTSCAYSSAPVDATLPAGGGSGYVDLTTAPTCAWTASSSAGWLTVEPATGVGSARITYAAGANTTGSQRATQIFIAGRSGVVRQGSVAGTLTITTTALPPATVGMAYSGSLTATGGTGAITWSLAGGTLPSGLTLSAAGGISGTATVPGTTTFTVRATDATGATATRPLSVVVSAPSSPVLAPPVVNRPTLTLSWTPPATGPAPTGYTIVASLVPGGPLVAQLPVGAVTSFTVATPDGTFFVRVLASVNGALVSSNEIRVDIVPPPLPFAPQALTAAVAGSVITFAWQPPAGSTISDYMLEAGSGPGLSNLATLPLGNVLAFVTPAVPNGSYHVRVRARNSSGVGPASNEVRVVVGPPPPSAPVLSGSGSAGGVVTLTWSVPGTGAPVTGYRLRAGSVPGASDLAVIGLPVTQTTLNVGGVPAGTYYVCVAAASSQGLGECSNEVVLTVP